MASGLDLVLWDAFGPVLEAVNPSYQAALNVCEFLRIAPPFSDVESYRSRAQRGVRVMISDMVGRQNGSTGERRSVEDALSRYEASMLAKEPVAVPGIERVLERLGRFDVVQGVVTNLPQEWVMPRLDRLGLSRYFNVYMFREQGSGKESLLGTVLSRCSDPGRVALVGDRVPDALAARRAGIGHVVLVTYGLDTHERIAGELRDAYYEDAQGARRKFRLDATADSLLYVLDYLEGQIDLDTRLRAQ
jgi:phosphoglycolate phosphatase-like HAD superfamily hydrolase